MDALQQLSFVLLLLSLKCPSEAKQNVHYITDEDEINSIPGDFYPYCVEVSDISPPPHSILQPTYMEPKKKIAGYTHYVFRVSFSRPVGISGNDTTAGWQPELLHIPVGPHGRMEAYENSFTRAVKRAGFVLYRVSPIFLTPSRSLLQKYYAVNIAHWQGSSKEFLVHFAVPAHSKGPNLTLSQKVYLVIDGGRFYSFGKIRGVRHAIFVPTTIIGEFYFEEYVRRNAWFKPHPPVRFQPTPYCERRTQRPLSWEGAKSNAVQDLTVRLNSDAHRLETSINDKQLSLNLSLSVIGVGGTFSFALPKVINVMYKKANVTVKLPDKLTINVTKPSVAPKLFIPVKRVPVYELREGIYHNGPKIMTTGVPPAFSYHVNFSDNARDLKEGLFPDVKFVATESTLVNMETIEMTTGIRLGEYFPFWEHRHLNWNQLPFYEWMEVSRNAPIAAKHDSVRYRKYTWYFHNTLVTKYRFLADNSRQCPADSNRNSGGRNGATLEHVVEYGPLYHLLEPLHSSYWSVEGKTIDITLTNDKGANASASVHSPHSGMDLNIPSIISEGLRQYRCLLPPMKDIPKPSRPTTVNEKWHPLDKCIFVPTSTADSMECGGLKLFRNISIIFGDKSFCNHSFGDCVGLPFSSLKRFPVIPTFGLPELTGWTECPSDLCPLSSHQQHPAGRHSVDGTKIKAMPRSILKFSKTKNTHDNTMDDIQMELSPVYNADSKNEYTIVLKGVEVVKPVLSSQPFPVEKGSSPLSTADCETVWMLETEPLNLNSIHPQEATLSATVYNIGQGGGHYLFDVQCSDYLSVHPETSVTMWMEPKTSANVTFVMSGLLAGSSPKLVHKCELLVRLERDIEPVLVCSKWLTTYYGAFEFPCDFEADVPTVDIVYYVLPSSQYKSAHLQQVLDTVIPNYLKLVKVITLSLSLPSDQTDLLKMLHYLRVSCQSDDVVVLLDQQLLHGSMRSDMFNGSSHNMKQPVIIQYDFTAPKRVYFLAKRSWLDSQRTLSPPLSLCEVVLTGHSPNWVCQREEMILDRVAVPLTRADIEHSTRGGLFKRQSDLVVTILTLCVITGLVSALMVSLGIAVLFAYRSRLPKNGTLKSLKRDLDKARESDKEYWDNPAMYLCVEASSASDGCQQYGEEHCGPHFTLHQWRATEKLNTKNVKHLKIAGTLKYKMKELPVMFGHVKKIYSRSDKKSGNVWVQASSGMYLLPMSTVAPDYVPNVVELYKTLGIAKRSYMQLLKRKVEIIEKENPVSQVDDKLRLNDDLEGLCETKIHSPTHTSLEQPSRKAKKHSKLAKKGVADKTASDKDAMNAAAAETDSEADETMPLL